MIMKTLIILLAVIIQVTCIAQSEPLVKVYNPDGSFTQYKIEDIENIKFIEDSYSTKFQVYANHSLVFDKYTYFINQILFQDFGEPRIIIQKKYPYAYYPDSILVKDLDSIIIYNTNLFGNKIYSEAELIIENLFCSYWDYSYDSENNKDSTLKKLEIKYNDNFQNKIHFSSHYAGPYAFKARYCDLLICRDSFRYITDGGTGTGNEKENIIFEIFINKNEQKIDYLIFTDNSSYSFSSSSTHGNGFRANRTYKFYNLEYSFDEESNLIIEGFITEADKIDLNYYYNSYTHYGGGENYSTTIKSETVVIQDEPIHIKLILR